MDVAKYTGLFLLKNHSCYIQGLGNLELKKRPAVYDGQALHAPSYEVVLTPTGSIDESLANFIASSELISISKAIAALQDFSVKAKADLQAGKEVIIPSIGKFVEIDGKVQFATDPKLQHAGPAIQATRYAKRTEEPTEPKPTVQQIPPPKTTPAPTPAFQPPQPNNALHTPPPPPIEGRRLNWARVFLVFFIFLVMVAGAFLAYRYIQQQNAESKRMKLPSMDTTQKNNVTPPPATTVHGVDTTMKNVVDSTTANSTAANDDTTNDVDSATGAKYLPESNIAVKKDTLYYKVILNKYYTMAPAEKRVKQLRAYGLKGVQLDIEDSLNFYVLLPVRSTSRDTTRILDSLSHLYNPKNGVAIY